MNYINILSEIEDLNPFWTQPEQWVDTYEDGLYQLKHGKPYVLIPWSKVPLDQQDNIAIAGVSTRIPVQYFLCSNKPINNLALYPKNTKIHAPVEFYALLSDIQPTFIFTTKEEAEIEIVLQTEHCNLSKTLFQAPLSTQEFIPEAAVGFIVAITLYSNEVTRKTIYPYHQAISGNIGFIERSLKKQFGPKVTGIHVTTDNQSNYHGMVLMAESKVEYCLHSQSTFVDFIDNFAKKINSQCI